METTRRHRTLFLGALALGALLVAAACGGTSTNTASPDDAADASNDRQAVADGAAHDASRPVDAGAFDASGLAPCPASGDAGAFSAKGALCFEVTPVATGEPSTGENADVPHYALRPAGVAPSTLVLFFIGSRGKPSGVLKAGPTKNLYAAAVEKGHAVLGLSYSNQQSLGMICQHDDGCFFPSRESIILGTSDADSGITITPDESIVDRTAKALRYLAKADSAGGWGAFLTTESESADPRVAIQWQKVLATGHSQGGGHAAALGKLFAVNRVIQLSSTCDNTGAAAASWTNGATGTWASDPTRFYGFAAPSTLLPGGGVTGDQTCPYHALSWANLGMLPGRQRDDAAICGDTGDTHDESLRCPDNYAAWLRLFE